MITSISGIRGVFNQDLGPRDLVRFSRNFTSLTGHRQLLLARDTRPTGGLIARIVTAAMLRDGVGVVDYGVVSTPALFRESRLRQAPAIMVTASHNEPEWNGLKFLIDGRGIGQEELAKIIETRRYPPGPVSPGVLRHLQKCSYNTDLPGIHGGGSCDGVRVVLDMNGGASVGHAPVVLRMLGCEVVSIGDAPSLFNRRIDPTADGLEMLRSTVLDHSAQVGFAFDCDGDRLVIVDNEGRKRSGDFMLTMAIREALARTRHESVVVSVDTTKAIEEMVTEAGGKIFESRVGESNVLQTMSEVNATLGGEGSSGGLIDSTFNNCRDSMVAAITIVRALKERGTRAYGQVRSYHQSRIAFKADRRKAAKAIKKLQREEHDAGRIDGVKVRPSEGSWVLIRPSGTEDLVRVSAESKRSAAEAEELARSFQRRLLRLCERV